MYPGLHLQDLAFAAELRGFDCAPGNVTAAIMANEPGVAVAVNRLTRMLHACTCTCLTAQDAALCAGPLIHNDSRPMASL